MKRIKQTKLKKNISNFDIFRNIIAACISEIENTNLVNATLISDLRNFFSHFQTIIKFAFIDRFVPAPKKKKSSKKQKRTPAHTRDLILYLYGPEQESKKKPEMLTFLDLIAALKLLENYILRRQYSRTLEGFQLGHLRPAVEYLYKNLPKLLKDIDSVDNVVIKRKLLSVLFSLATIYRHIKASTKPNVSTIISPYNGSSRLVDLTEDKSGIFGLSNISN